MSSDPHPPEVSTPAPHPTAPSEPAASGAPDAPDTAGAPEGGSEGQPGTGAPGEGGRRRRRRRRRGAREGAEQGAPGAEGAEGEPQAAGQGGPRPERHHPHRNDRGPHGDRNRHDRNRHGSQHGPQHGKQKRAPEHHARIAVDALGRMAHALLKIGGVDVLSMPRFLDLNLRIPLDESDVGQAADAAAQAILARVREVREHERALRPGAVYCYFQGSADGEGTRPTEPRQVFDGFSSTGRPVFTDFVTMAIERKDPGIDRMLGGEDIVLTHVTMGRVLRTQQLAEFGGNSPVFRILGQVDAGLFKVLGAEQRAAFSFQLLRGTTLEGKPRLRLHAVGAVDLMDLADPSVLHILSRFQRRLDAEALRLAGKAVHGEVDEEEFVLPLLNELAQKLAGRQKHRSRRTAHADERSEEGQRPTPRAYPDATEAHDGAILWDSEKSTVVVLGPKGRVHVFTPQAKHVTSVMMQGSAIERRRHMGRWRLAEPDERGEFRIQLKRLVASGEDKPAADEVPQALV
ncbi:MAG: hypothetical protein RIT25_2595 [Planctomycetota bacterium]